MNNQLKTKTMSRKSKIINNKLKIKNGFALPIVITAVVILVALAVGLTMVSYGARLQAVRVKCETAAMLAAEAGYEQGIFWMSQQPDILSALQSGFASGTIDFENGSCAYEVQFEDYVGARPVFRIISTATNGTSSRVVDVAVIQAINGWAMGKCRVPLGTTTTTPVNFADGEIIDVPVHINNLKDSPDDRDIYINGSPRFEQKVEMGESRQAGHTDKYGSVMDLFQDAIYFDQPDVRITDEAAVQSKVNRFRDSTNPAFRFTPHGTANVDYPRDAVQLEFFVEGGIGKVRITDNCTVRAYHGTTYDYKIVPGSGGNTYQKYDIYAYHYAPKNVAPIVKPVEDSYVTQTFGTKQSEPGGQIFVDGDVIIGSNDYTDMVVKGKMTVVASGNIWIADSIVVDGARNPDELPADTNPNVLGLITQGVVKVVDPGMSNCGFVNTPQSEVSDTHTYAKHTYRPVANPAGGVDNNRKLPHTMIVEAAVTVGGGGWGAENVRSSNGRKVTGPGNQDLLILRGTLSESIRAVVGLINTNGYLKRYYLDKRLLEGILPGDIWFSGKYVPAPAGWHDYRPGT